MRFRPLLVAASSALAACLITGAPDAVELPPVDPATVTEAQLGEGSTIALIERGGATSLEVVTPDGVRHPLAEHRGDVSLADWRPDLHTAVLFLATDDGMQRAVAHEVTTGAIHTVVLPRRAYAAALDREGTGLLLATYAGGPAGRLATLGWDGERARLPATSSHSAITSVDGATLVIAAGDRHAWWIVDPAARTSTSIDTPGGCDPVRWFDADSVVAQCFRAGTNRLRAVDLDGGSTVLGVRRRPGGRGIFLDGDIRVVQGRSWHQSYGGCRGLLTERLASGTVRRVAVPGLRGSLEIVGVRGDDLLVTRTAGCPNPDGSLPTRPRPLLALLDPVTGAHTVLTRLDADESWLHVGAATEVGSWG